MAFNFQFKRWSTAPDTYVTYEATTVLLFLRTNFLLEENFTFTHLTEQNYFS